MMKILVGTFKNYEYPKDTGYFPIHLGCALSSSNLCIPGDHTGDSISNLNTYFSELTGLYWLWKNSNDEYVGLVHYRRYFSAISDRSVIVRKSSIASSADLMLLMASYDIIIPKPRFYIIDTVKSHYLHSHHESDLIILNDLINEMCPEYGLNFENVFKRRYLTLFNMFFTRKEICNEYCEWLFPLLFELEKRIPYQTYDAYQARVFGFLAERLFNVWLDKNSSRLRIKKLPVVHIEGENLFKKALGLIKRKYSQY